MTTDTSQKWGKPVREYLETWAAAFADVMQQVSTLDGRVAPLDDEAESVRAREATAGGLVVRFECSGKLAGRQRMAVSVADAVTLGRFLTEETGKIPSELPETERDAATELLRQVAGMAAGRLKERDGEEVQFRECEQDPPEWKPQVSSVIRIQAASAEAIHVVLEIDEALGASLAKVHSPEAEPTSTEKASDGGEVKEATNLNLLLDIELEASIRFGQKELLLKDVLNLRPGTVVELTRRVNEPAELLVAGRLMARGEVVVVEGNYGLRITEILGPAERMAAIQG